MNIFKRIPKTPDERAKLKSDRYLLIIAGVLMGFAYPPVPLPVTAFIALVPLLIVLERREKLIDLNRAVYLFAFVTGVVALYWVGAYTVAKDRFLMIGGGLMLFANPVSFLIPVTLYYGVIRSGFMKKENAIWLIPPFWAAYEYFYMNVDVNFPWITISNTLADFQLFYKFSDVVGPLGMTMILIWINIAIYKLWKTWQSDKKPDRVALRVLTVLVLLPVFYSLITTDDKPADETLRVGLVQPDLDPYQKWSGGPLEQILDKYLKLSDKAVKEGAKLVIWPETALPVFILNGQYPEIVERLHKYVDSTGVPILTGMPHVKFFQPGEPYPSDAKRFPDGEIRFATYNSVLLFTPGDPVVQQYGKHKLVPFGERTPYIDQIPFLGDMLKWGVGISSWNVGEGEYVFPVKTTTSKGKREVKVGALVCFESVFPYYAAEFTLGGAEFLAVVTNDSWYGNTSGPHQHKEFSNLRAIENHRAVVRAANGGVSCLIDQSGHTVKETKMFEENVITVDVPLQTRGTIFLSTSKVIPYGVWAVSLIAALLWLTAVVKERFHKKGK